MTDKFQETPTKDAAQTRQPNGLDSLNKKQQKRIKQINFEDNERKRRKALYGTRASSKIFESAAITSRRQWVNGIDKNSENLDNKGSQKQCKDKIIISSTSKWKAIFDVFILLLVGYSCITSMLYVAFTTSNDKYLEIFESFVETMFWFDLFLNFIQSFKHPETLEIVTDLKGIAKNYIFKGWFIIDFVSVFPFQHFIPQGQITKLFRLARLPRLIKLIDISRFQKVLQSLMSNQSRDEKIVAQYMMLYVYKIFRLIIIAIIITYFIGCIWFMFCTIYNDTEPNSFIKKNNLDKEDQTHQLIISCYYALTTLSTVGYGDYYPISNNERIIAVVIMLGGVAFFSYIMGNFIEIISNYEKKMGVVDKSGDLHNWLILLTRFTNNQPLPKSLTAQIEANFSYYWAQDRLACLNTDDQYLEALPRKIKNQIMTVYLFSDVFKTFKRFFNVESMNDSHTFLYDCAFGFMPRKFEPTPEDKIIYDEEEEVLEMYFVTEGIIGIGFSLIANGVLDKQYSVAKKQSGSQIICDHYVVNQCKSQFIYMALIKDVKCFALTKKFMHEQVFPKYPEICQKIQEESFKVYKKQIFKPINEQRKHEIQQMNKKSVYRQIQFIDVKDKSKNASKFNIENSGPLQMQGNIEAKNKLIADKIVSQNLNDNIGDVQQELSMITQQIKEMIENCDSKINEVIEQVSEAPKVQNNNFN